MFNSSGQLCTSLSDLSHISKNNFKVKFHQWKYSTFEERKKEKSYIYLYVYFVKYCDLCGLILFVLKIINFPKKCSKIQSVDAQDIYEAVSDCRPRFFLEDSVFELYKTQFSFTNKHDNLEENLVYISKHFFIFATSALPMHMKDMINIFYFYLVWSLEVASTKSVF